MIAQLRDVVAHHLDGSPWPVHRRLPGDVAEVPCIAVPRPRLVPAEHTLVTGQVVVLVVGNRLGNDSASDELDAITDLVIDRFGGISKSVRIEDPNVQKMLLQEVNPTAVVVAGQEYPCYALTIEVTMAPC